MCVAEVSFYKENCSLLPYLLVWFLSSILLSLTNRYAYGILHFPLLLHATSFHFLVQFLFGYWYTTYVDWKQYRHELSSLSTSLFEQMSWLEYLEIALPVGIFAALDIGLSNMGVSLIPISIYTILRSATPLFVLFLSFAMGLEKPSVKLCLVMLLITVGEVLTYKKNDEAAPRSDSSDLEEKVGNRMMVAIAEEDDLLDPLSCYFYTNESAERQMLKGSILILLSTFSNALRWTILQLKIAKLRPELRNPFALLRIISPAMFVFLFSVALVLERDNFELLPTCSSVAIIIGFSNGLMAIPLMVAEYAIIIKASAIVLMISSVCKEIMTILFGVYLFQETMTHRAWFGFAIVTCGAILYKLDKMKKEKQPQNNIDKDEDTAMGISPTSDGATRSLYGSITDEFETDS